MFGAMELSLCGVDPDDGYLCACADGFPVAATS